MRSREFDEADVLRIAFQAFRRKGVQAASLADIAREAGVQRGSLYNAYGSKQALFLLAYRVHKAEYLDSLAAALARGTLRQRLDRFFDAAIRSFRAGPPPLGCPTTRGLMELGCEPGEGLDAEAREAFADLLRQVVTLLEDALSDGKRRGEFQGDPRQAAWHLATVARGLVVMDRAFEEGALLRRIARNAVAAVLHPSRTKSSP